ncbi:DENN domain-containing protein 5B isoform X2 [Condylostylus longicornis]|uniref:DENN domain-containing protein 5B isoform X2 n=1 Tax=Condylostylus longicornis TaxID=2530218 RepID=UPI00244DEFFD|nr:DENN domain-containing protein 5B isoform X2 [Condylostylus longicornis]
MTDKEIETEKAAVVLMSSSTVISPTTPTPSGRSSRPPTIPTPAPRHSLTSKTLNSPSIENFQNIQEGLNVRSRKNSVEDCGNGSGITKETALLEATLKCDPQFSRFADYFVICGLDLDEGLEPDRFAGDSLHCSPLERAYKSKPLCHYPENVPWNPFDAAGICMLSLPQGLRFRTQKHNIEANFHSFATTREDGKRCHGFSLIFYEEVRNRNICSAMQTLQAMFITELSNSQATSTLRRVKEGPVSRSLPRHFKMAAAPTSALSYYDVTKDKLYVAKSISLVCQVPYAWAAEIFLTNLYKCLPRSPGPGLSLESYVYNILYEVMLPQPGKSIRIYLPPEEPQLPPIPMILQRPDKDELPLLDFPIRLLFSYLGVECVIQLFTCVLLENQVLLRSNDYQKLMIIGECITSLLHPFVWPHVYAPILPAALHHFLDAPVPFLMGLHADCEINAKIGSEATLCYVDIDRKTIQLPEELPIFPHKLDFMSEIITILDKYQIQRDKSLEPRNQRNYFHQPVKTVSLINGACDYDPMTSSCTLPSGMQVRGRKSSMHDSFYASDHSRDHSAETAPLISGSTKPEPMPRMMDIMKRSAKKLDDFIIYDDSMPKSRNTKEKPLTLQDQYVEDQRLNNSIRELFLNRFVHMFAAYDQFVIFPNQGKEEWLSNRESLQNFDKASFLSDQPEHHRPFLCRFLESQMFATLIDNKIMAVWEKEIDTNLKLFDARIKILRKRHGGESMLRANSYEPCVLNQEAQRMLEKRLITIDLEVTPPSEILPNRPAYFRGFPLLEKSVLNQECASRGNSLRRVKNGSTKWRTKEINLEGKPPPVPATNRNSAHLTTSDMSPALIAQANWTFVEKLLKDVKTKTKRMLLEKMGNEAFLLGLSGENVNGIEENTLIASLCDLLEKIWSHGLQNKQGKSALWSHLQAYMELHEPRNSDKIDSNFLAPDRSTFKIEPESPASPTRGRLRDRIGSIVSLEQLRPLPESIEFDFRNVLAMTDIRTPIGYTRAWIRLSLEKKLLSRHFRTLLSDQGLLRLLYKRSAFLRCEEEKEQFLYHILTLNTVDYYCFTNIYPTTKLPYRIIIFPSKKHGNAQTSSNVWIAISGALCETKQIPVPKGTLEFVFHHKNLGLLTTMRIGHDNYGPINKWMVEHVVVRNEVTEHTYKFPCGRWLGKGIDDGSSERLLVGQRVPKTVDTEELVQVCQTPPRARSPSIQRTELRPSEIQNMIGDCVNTIVKWHYKPSKDRDVGSLTNLLCGEDGLVKCLEHVFLCGFRSTRFFGKNLFLWDYFAKVKEQFEINLNFENFDSQNQRSGNESPSIFTSFTSVSNDSPYLPNMTSAQRHEWISVWRCFVYLIDEINSVTNSLGKDGKFQLFMCLCLREHILHRMLSPMAATKVTQELYEEQSFLRRRGLLTFLIQILEPLDEFHIVLENSITQGIPSQC